MMGRVAKTLDSLYAGLFVTNIHENQVLQLERKS